MVHSLLTGMGWPLLASLSLHSLGWPLLASLSLHSLGWPLLASLSLHSVLISLCRLPSTWLSWFFKLTSLCWKRGRHLATILCLTPSMRTAIVFAPQHRLTCELHALPVIADLVVRVCWCLTRIRLVFQPQSEYKDSMTIHNQSPTGWRAASVSNHTQDRVHTRPGSSTCTLCHILYYLSSSIDTDIFLVLFVLSLSQALVTPTTTLYPLYLACTSHHMSNTYTLCTFSWPVLFNLLN